MRTTMRHVAVAVRQYGKLAAGELMGRGRLRELALLRQVAHWLCVRRVGKSTLETGTFFQRDHTTIIHSVRAVDNRLLDDTDDGEVAKIIEQVWELAINPKARAALTAENDNQDATEPLPRACQVVVRAPVEDHSRFYVML